MLYMDYKLVILIYGAEMYLLDDIDIKMRAWFGYLLISIEEYKYLREQVKLYKNFTDRRAQDEDLYSVRYKELQGLYKEEINRLKYNIQDQDGQLYRASVKLAEAEKRVKELEQGREREQAWYKSTQW